MTRPARDGQNILTDQLLAAALGRCRCARCGSPVVELTDLEGGRPVPEEIAIVPAPQPNQAEAKGGGPRGVTGQRRSW